MLLRNQQAKFILVFSIILVLFIPMISPKNLGHAQGGVKGAIYTTDDKGIEQNPNHFNKKIDVYFKLNTNFSLGSYYIRVVAPGGHDVLGQSIESVNLDSIDNVYHLWDLVSYKKDGEVKTGYRYTSNEGKEYQIEISTKSSFNTSEGKSDNFKVTRGQEKISIVANKVWEDDSEEDRPTIKLQLYRDDEPLGEPIELTSGNFTNTWTELDKYHDNEDEYEYTVDEVDVPENYTKTVSNDGLIFTITNTYDKTDEPGGPEEPEKISVVANKVWVGGSEEDRPTIKLQLYRDDEPLGEPIELTSDNLSHTWTKLDKYDDNEDEYEYTVDEVDVPENYTKTVSNDGLTFTITNTYNKTDEPEVPEEPEKPEKPEEPEKPEKPKEPEEDEIIEIEDDDIPVGDVEPDIEEEEIVEIDEEEIPVDTPEVDIPEALPQTGETIPYLTYMAGGLLIALGKFLKKFIK